MACTVAIPTSPSPAGSPAGAFVTSPSSPLRPRVMFSPRRSPSPLQAGGSLLKRRRPPMLVVPPEESAAASVAAALRSDGRREVEVCGEEFAVYCKRGKRRLVMEDRHASAVGIGNDPKTAFFGVFDGHGGHKAAEFASSSMPMMIEEELENITGDGCSVAESAVRDVYLRTDAEFLKENEEGGACSVTALLWQGNLVVSNAGDCRAVLSRGGIAEALTSDHRPPRDDERARIENLGGIVMNIRGTWRLQGSLAVSRGIGDSHLKQFVTPEPETRTLRIDPDCEFLILASDGLWEKVSNQEAVNTARPMCRDGDTSSVLSACKKLAELSASRGSADDTSVMIIQLQQFAH